MNKLLIVLIATVLLSSCNQNEEQLYQDQTIVTQESADHVSREIANVTTAKDWVMMCGEYPELCVPVCQRDAKACAARINEFVTTSKEGGSYLFQGWPLFPGTGPKHANQLTPMHGAYLSIHVNKIAEDYINEVLSAGSSGKLDYVDFPNGAMVVKQNFASSDGDPNEVAPWLTVMWKLDGYCHGNFAGAGPCTGGEWFYYLSRFGGFETFDGQPAYGKAQAFCTDCHGPVQKGDFLWTLFAQLKAFQPATSEVPSERPATMNVVEYCSDTPINPIVPGDVFKKPSEAEQKQLMFDCLSWRTFVALNWPAKGGERGVPDTEKSIGDVSGPRVWETYREIFEVFQPDNPTWSLDKVDWNSQQSLNPVCGDANGQKVLRMNSKSRTSPVLNETHQAFGNQFNILVDQNGNQLHYEVSVNRDEFEFFKANGYANTGNYTAGGPLSQLSWKSKPLHFPDNVRGTEGAIEIKSAWRVMCTDSSCTTKDDLSMFYTRDVQIYKPLADGSASCESAIVGLVGMHIGHKTFWAPQWVWSTFEHVNNVPPAGQAGEPGVQYGLYSQTSTDKRPANSVCAAQRPGALPTSDNLDIINCPNNQLICNSHPSIQPEMKVDLSNHCKLQLEQSTKQNPKAKHLIPNQVIRLDKISDSPLNQSYPKALAEASSVLSNYRLVNTQWPLNGRGTPGATTINMRLCGEGVAEPCYSLKPEGLRLRNTTMETFQTTYNDSTDHPSGQTSSEGCMQCHGLTGLDFSFAWTDAAEEKVIIIGDELSDPPAGSYLNTCTDVVMAGGTLNGRCLTNIGGRQASMPLPDAHLCTGDISNINGNLLCNAPVGSFSLSCNAIEIDAGVLSANCETRTGKRRQSSLNVKAYKGVIENCDGTLTKGRCA